jgi:hypothetical protein
VTNSNYGKRPYCFDTCHLADGSFERHSNLSSIKNVQDRVTKPPCFEIESLSPSPSEQLLLPLFMNDSISNYTSNSSISASAISIISSSWSSIIVNSLTFIFVLLLKIFQK